MIGWLFRTLFGGSRRKETRRAVLAADRRWTASEVTERKADWYRDGYATVSQHDYKSAAREIGMRDEPARLEGVADRAARAENKRGIEEREQADATALATYNRFIELGKARDAAKEQARQAGFDISNENEPSGKSRDVQQPRNMGIELVIKKQETPSHRPNQSWSGYFELANDNRERDR
jgi:hypothetical protein